ncbi:MAG: hypothetical protein R3F05_20550 [Planctomycetota bacterium]
MQHVDNRVCDVDAARLRGYALRPRDDTSRLRDVDIGDVGRGGHGVQGADVAGFEAEAPLCHLLALGLLDDANVDAVMGARRR